MDPTRLDELAQTVSTGTSRRALAAVLAALGVALTQREPAQTTPATHCHPHCTECQFCRLGRCHNNSRGRRICRPGGCRNLVDGAICTGGTCLSGVCQP